MSGSPSKRQRLLVTLPDGRDLTADVDARDFMAYDVARARRGWPAGSDAGFLLMQYLAWSALRRAGGDDAPVGAHFDVDDPPFIDLQDVAPAQDVDPTPPGPGPG